MRRLRRTTLSTIGALAMVAATLVGLAPSASAAATTFSNTSSITLNDPGVSGVAEASPYPSPITVSGLSGNVSHLTLTLSGINYQYSQDIQTLLVGPTGKSLIAFSQVGADDPPQATATNDTVIVDDSAATRVSQDGLINPALGTNQTTTTQPVDNAGPLGFVPNDFPGVPAPWGDAAPSGSDTLGSVFNGTDPNGTWKLYVVIGTAGDGTGSISGGWSLAITTAASVASTTTSVTSSENPSFTAAPDNTVTLTATVTSAGSPVTAGTVAFTDGGNPISGCGAASLNGGGEATCSATFATEGGHPIQATYSGTSSGTPLFATSYGSLSQEVDNHTVVSGATFANPGTITMPNQATNPDPSTPYPSHITASNLATVTDLTVTLSGVSFPYAQDINALLVGPQGQSLVLLSNVGPSSGTTAASNVSVTFDDGAGPIPSTTPLGNANSSVTTTPVDYSGADTDTFPAPAPSGPYGTPAPRGSATLGSTFDGTNPNGTWSLYIVTTGGAEGTGSVARGWSITFAVATQTVRFTSTAPANAAVGGPTYTPAATGGASGNPVVFSIDSSSTAGACSIAASVVSFTGAGTCIIDANQAGDANYQPAPQAQQTITVGQGTQTITFTSTAPANATVGGPTYTPTATGGASGNPVVFSIDSSSTAGACSIAASVVSFTGAGTCIIDANQAGDANYQPAPQTQQTITVGQGTQTITFTSTAPANATVGGPTYTPTATASSGLPVTFTTSTPGACSITTGVVAFTGAGTCIIDANQAGDANYQAATQVQQTITVGQGTQTITFTSTAPANATVGGPTYTPAATGGASGNPVVFSIDSSSAAGACSIAAGVVAFTGAGSCVIDANQAGDANYQAAAPVQQQVQVHAPPIVSTITVASSPSGLSGIAGAGKIVLSWTAPVSTGGSPITGYVVYRGTGAGAESPTALATVPADQLSYTDATVTPGITYYYVVTAVNAAGASSPSNEASAVVKAAPAGGSPVTATPVATQAGGGRVAVTPDRQGYWVLQPGAGVRAFGAAVDYGSEAGRTLNAPVVGIAATPDGHGYWLVASDGGVFTFGDAAFYGSTGNVRLNAPVIGMAPAPDGHGYWLVAPDGGVFAFGDAGFYGSTGNVRLNAPVVGIAATPDGHGYWLVASDGGVFTFGDAGFYGSAATSTLSNPIIGFYTAADGAGYTLVDGTGRTVSFGA